MHGANMKIIHTFCVQYFFENHAVVFSIFFSKIMQLCSVFFSPRKSCRCVQYFFFFENHAVVFSFFSRKSCRCVQYFFFENHAVVFSFFFPKIMPLCSVFIFKIMPLCSVFFFFENHAVYEMMWNNIRVT